MAAYSAFYDTSGHRSSQGDDSAIVTAGLLASEAQWVGFEREWNALLAAAQIPYLHMRQLRNAFDGRPDEQARFLDKAVRLLRKRMTMAFVVSVIPRDFRVVSEEFELARVMESPHQVAVGTCALLGHLWFAGSLNHEARHSLVQAHEAGDLGIGKAQEFARRHGATLGTRAAQSGDRFVVGFQAGDFIAWEIRRLWVEVLRQELRPTRQSLIDISYGLTKQVHMWDADALRNLCRTNSIPARRAHLPRPS